MAMRKGRLTIEEKEYLQKHKDVPVEKLVKKLKRSAEAITGYLNKDVPEEVEPESKQGSYVRQLFAKKEDRGVTIMTEAASMFMDERRKTYKNNLDQSFIHKIYKDR